MCIGVVIDDGGYSGTGPAAVQAANVDPGSSDLQALQAAHDTPYQNNSGLVCAIDDGTGQVPADGVQSCLSTTGSGQYYYWSYWGGDPYTNTWTYANVGPASHTVSAGQTYVEGWRYQNPGPDNPSATKPSVSPSAAFAQACPGVTPVPSGGSGNGAGSGSGGGGSAGSAGGSAPGPASSSASATNTTGVPGNGSAGARTAPGGTTSPGNSLTTTSHPGAETKAPPGPTHGTSTTTSTTSTGANTHDGKTALADQRGRDGTGGGDPTLPIVIVAVVILALGGLAWWRWRRRPLEE